MSVPLSRYALFAVIALVGGGLDLITKQVVFAWRGWPRPENEYWLIGQVFGIETSLNPGALFGMGAGNSHWFALLSVVAAVAIVTWLTYGKAAQDRWLTVALALVMGGIIGNLYDRVGLWHFADMPDEWKYNVRDWILFRYPAPWANWDLVPWPNFNIADSCLVVGAGVLMVHAFFTPSKPDTSPAKTWPRSP